MDSIVSKDKLPKSFDSGVYSLKQNQQYAHTHRVTLSYDMDSGRGHCYEIPCRIAAVSPRRSPYGDQCQSGSTLAPYASLCTRLERALWVINNKQFSHNNIMYTVICGLA